MNQRRVGAIAGFAAVLGMGIQSGGAMARGWLSAGELPAWAVYDTVGSSTVVYLYLIRMAVAFSFVILTVGGGYYLGRQFDVAAKYRTFVRTLATGSTVGVTLVWLVTMWPMLTTIGEAPDFGYVIQSRATQMLIVDVVVPIFALVLSVGEVGLLVTVGMLAGAALAQFGREGASSPDPLEGDTDAVSAGSTLR